MTIQRYVIQRKPFYCGRVQRWIISHGMLYKCVDPRNQSILRIAYNHINCVDSLNLLIDAYGPVVCFLWRKKTAMSIFKNNIDIPLWGYDFNYLTAVWKQNAI